MNENRYQKLMEPIKASAGLNDRVLFAARQRTAEQEEKTSGPKRLAPRRRGPLLRAAVCAACALALVAGFVTLRPAADGTVNPDGTPVLVPTYTFALTACAADTGEVYAPGANGGLALFSGSGQLDPEEGCYTGCLFQVTGEGIRTVSLSIDQGGLYRSETRRGLTDDEVRSLFQQEDLGELVCSVYGDDENAPTMNAEVMTALGDAITGDYDPMESYGFWVPPGEITVDEKMDMPEEFQRNVDVFDGATLTVTVTLEDGSTQTKDYRLSTGKLRVVYETDGTRTVLPQLAGEEEAYVYGVYADDQSESRWLEWPVQGSNTVSLSAPYGKSANGVIHNGLDIPAAEGTPILAAADGTVTEAGCDADRGNYLVLDHGGGLTTVYGQCRSVDVAEGDTVRAGEPVGTVGATGMATGSHLHFEVRQDGKAENPVAYFDSAVRDTLRAE